MLVRDFVVVFRLRPSLCTSVAFRFLVLELVRLVRDFDGLGCVLYLGMDLVLVRRRRCLVRRYLRLFHSRQTRQLYGYGLVHDFD